MGLKILFLSSLEVYVKMGIGDLLKDKLKGMFSEGFSKDETTPVFDDRDDFETRDKTLKAKRRMRRRQIDIIERRKLDKDILAFNRGEARKAFVGESLFDSTMDGGKRKKGKKVNQSFMGGSGFLGKGDF